MSSIGSLLSGMYGQINQGLTNANKSQAEKDAAKAPSLADMLNGGNDKSDAYLLSLSKEAQEQLKAARQNLTGSKQDSDTFTLNKYQKESLDKIIQKYAELPLTNENYEALQSDLYKAGIAPEQLSMMSRVTSFNSTQALVDALNGKITDPAQFLSGMSEIDEKKTENFLDGIVTKWQESYAKTLAAAEAEKAQQPADAAEANPEEDVVGDAGETSA